MIDLDHLERLARAATQERLSFTPATQAMLPGNCAAGAYATTGHNALLALFKDVADAEFFAAAGPSVVLLLVLRLKQIEEERAWYRERLLATTGDRS